MNFFRKRWCILLLTLQACTASNTYYDPQKPHHKPNGFVNSDGSTVSKSVGDLLKWSKARFKESLPPPPEQFVKSYSDFPVLQFDAARLVTPSATWLGHACILFKTKNLTLLTDPHFSERAFAVQWIGPKRKVASPVKVKDLPIVDVILISHNHFDHMDKNTLLELSKNQPHVQFLVPLGVEKIMQSWGIEKVAALDWWDKLSLQGNVFTFVPARHWSARSLLDKNETLWGGWAVQSGKTNFFFSGDTGYSKDFKEIGERLGPFDLSAIAVGAYEPRWFMKEQHVNPDEAVQIHLDVRSRQSIGIHWGTFELTDEPLDQPIGDLEKAKSKAGIANQAFQLLKHGETLTFTE